MIVFPGDGEDLNLMLSPSAAFVSVMSVVCMHTVPDDGCAAIWDTISLTYVFLCYCFKLFSMLTNPDSQITITSR